MGEVIREVIEFDTASAKTSVSGLNEEVKGLKGSTDTLTHGTAELGETMEHTAEHTHVSRRALRDFAGAVSVVNPEVGALTREVGHLLHGLELFGISIGVAGPVAIAVVGFIAIWKELSDAVKDAEAEMKKAADTASSMQEVHDKVREARTLADFKSGKITKDQYEFDKASEAGEALFNPKIRDVQEEREKLEQSIAGENATRLSHEEVMAARAKIGTLDTRIKELNAGMANYIDDVFTAGTEGIKHAKTDAEKLAEINARLASQRMVAAMGALIGKNNPDLLGVGKVFDPTVYHGFQGYQLGETSTYAKLSQLTVEEKAALGLGTQLNYTTPAPTSANVTNGYNPNQQQQLLASVSKGVQIAGSAAEGAPTGALAAAGPIGAIIAAVVGALTEVGKLGADGVRKKLDDFEHDIREGIKALPEILSEVLPDFDQSMVHDFLPALLQNLPKAIAEGVGAAIANGPSLLLGKKGSDGKQGLLDWTAELATFGLAKTDVDNGNNFLNNGKKGVGDWVAELMTFGGMKTDIGRKSYALGTGPDGVPEEGLYRLHPKEIVLNPNESDAYRQGMGGEVHHHYHMEGSVMGDQAAESWMMAKLSSALGHGGLGFTTAPIAGGVGGAR